MTTKNLYAQALVELSKLPDLFNGRTNPATGKPPMTNPLTQLMSNRSHGETAKMIIGGKEWIIRNFKPARSIQKKESYGYDGNEALPDHNESGTWRTTWSNAETLHPKQQEYEVFLNLAYLISSVATGKAISAESAMKAYGAVQLAEKVGINWKEVSFEIGDIDDETDSSSTMYTGEQVKGMLDFAIVKAKQILDYPTTRKGSKSNKVAQYNF